MAHLPFRWDLVDATYLYRPFAGLRAQRGLPAAPLAPEQAIARLTQALAAEPDPIAATLILHPFLMTEGAWPAYEVLLRELGTRAAAGDVRIVPGCVAAAELLGRHSAPLPVVG